ncbi:hypothetical protein ID866_2556 [Astraeus odoratus]|nr:hypothetical protein ID866_2556 [Astraeus odoratus]
MIPSDIDNLVLNVQTPPDRKPFSRLQKLVADKLHYNNTRSSIVLCSPQTQCHPDPRQPNYLVNSNLPPPGPAHYAARRALWLTPTKVPEHAPSSSSRLRLEQLLSQPGAVHSDEAWKGGVEKVWKGLVGGGRLRRRLPMHLVIKVIHAGWLRDPETWPTGAVAPESDDEPSRSAAPSSLPCHLPRLTNRPESCMALSKPDDESLVKRFQDIGELRSPGMATSAH